MDNLYNNINQNNVKSKYKSIPKYKEWNNLKYYFFGNNAELFFMVLNILISLIIGILTSSFSLIIANFINSFSNSSIEKIRLEINKNIILMLYILLALFILYFSDNLITEFSTKKMIKKFIAVYFKNLLEKESSYTDSIKASKIKSNFIENAKIIDDFYTSDINSLFNIIGILLGSIIIGFYTGYLITLYFIGVAFIFSIWIYITRIYLKKKIKLNKDSYKEAKLITENIFKKIKLIKSYQSEDHEIERFGDIIEKNKNNLKKNSFVIGALYAFYYFLFFIMYIFIIFVGQIIINNNQINTKTGLEYTIGNILTIVFSVLVTLNMLIELEKILPLIIKGKSTLNNIISFLKVNKMIDLSSEDGLKPELLKGEIEFKNVTFSYPSNKDLLILKNLNFKILEGESVAFIGESGSGKSTILQLINRYYDPNQGTILVDGIDIKKYNIYHLRNLIGSVNQKPVLFSKNIRNNFKLGLKDDETLTNDTLNSALDKITSEKINFNLENNFNNIYGYYQFTRGEEQRISLTRAILKNQKIFLFDDPLSSVDKNKKIELLNSWNLSNRTIITTSNRYIKNINKIFILKNGEIIESGNHKDLIELKKEYYKFQKLENNFEKFEQIKEKEVNKSQQRNNINPNSKKKFYDNSFIDGGNNYNKIIIFSSILFSAFIIYFSFLFSDILTNFINFELVKKVGPVASGLNKIEIRDRIYLLLLYMFILIFVAFLFYFLSKSYVDYCSKLFDSNLKINYFKCLMYKDMDFFDKEGNKPENLTNQLFNDLNEFSFSLYDGKKILAGYLTNFLACLIISFISSWRLTLINFGIYIIIVIISIIFKNEITIWNNDSIFILTESINNIKIIWSLSAHKKIIAIFLDTIKNYKKLTIFKNAFFETLKTIIIFSIYWLLFFLGGLLIQKYNEILLDIIRAVFVFYFSLHMSHYEYNFKINRLKINKEIENNIETENNWEKNIFEVSKIDEKIILNEFNGKIEFKNVNFKYPEINKWILKNVSFIINPKEKILFVGDKYVQNAILEILLRFYKIESGEILLNNINIEKININTLRSQFGVIFQKNNLFDNNILYNIQYNKKFSNEQIISSSKKSLAYDFIINNNIMIDNNKNIYMDTLPSGYYFEVGYKGEKLTEDQKLKICITRCLIKNPILYLFEEINPTLYNKSENEIQENINNIIKNKTAIFFNHKISTIQNPNKIFVIIDGFIVEEIIY